MAEQRLIDANAADVERICCYYGDNCRIEDVQEWLDEQPTIDAAPVVHARWEPIDGIGGSIYKLWRCSSCKNGSTTGGETGPDVPYCFSCGAKMDGGSE